MLHRGKYSIPGEHGEEAALPPTGLKALMLSKEFTWKDKLVYFALMGWMLFFFCVFVVVTVYHFIWGTTEGFWIFFWSGWMKLTIILSVLTTIWFAIGGCINMKQLFHTLKTATRNDADDGRVIETERE